MRLPSSQASTSPLPLPAVYLLSLFMIAVIIAIDVHTEAYLSLSVVYLLPVVMASWYGNRTAGLLVSLISCISWILVDVSEREDVHPAAPYWEATARLGTYLLVATVISQLRRSVRREHEQLLNVARLNATLEQKVEKRTRELQENIRELQTFTYTMAHDLRGPLRAIHGFSDVLRDEYGAVLKESGKDYLRRMSDSAVHMDGLIRDLLAYARLIHQPVDPAPVLLEDVLKGVLRDMDADLKERHAAVQVGPLEERVVAQRDLLSEVLRRLLHNAARYVRDGSEPQIRIRSEREDGWVRLWIEDNGVGIARENWDRIFGLGERLEPGGSGMGLAFARKAMARMKGRVGVDSQVGTGSRFWLDLRPADAGPVVLKEIAPLSPQRH